MIKTYHVKTGDKVVVNTGEFKGGKGKIAQILKKKDRIVVELEADSLSAEQQSKVNNRLRTVKKSQANPEGGMIARPVSVHVSNVNKLDS